MKTKNLSGLQEKFKKVEWEHVNKEPFIMHQIKNVKQKIDTRLSEEVENKESPTHYRADL